MSLATRLSAWNTMYAVVSVVHWHIICHTVLVYWCSVRNLILFFPTVYAASPLVTWQIVLLVVGGILLGIVFVATIIAYTGRQVYIYINVSWHPQFYCALTVQMKPYNVTSRGSDSNMEYRLQLTSRVFSLQAYNKINVLCSYITVSSQSNVIEHLEL